jgi:hypothetical protein
MRPICKLYTRICRTWGPRGLTLSAFAWVHAQETGNVWWRNRIDGAFLLLAGQANHCQSQFQRERANNSEGRND